MDDLRQLAAGSQALIGNLCDLARLANCGDDIESLKCNIGGFSADFEEDETDVGVDRHEFLTSVVAKFNRLVWQSDEQKNKNNGFYIPYSTVLFNSGIRFQGIDAHSHCGLVYLLAERITKDAFRRGLCLTEGEIQNWDGQTFEAWFEQFTKWSTDFKATQIELSKNVNYCGQWLADCCWREILTAEQRLSFPNAATSPEFPPYSLPPTDGPVPPLHHVEGPVPPLDHVEPHPDGPVGIDEFRLDGIMIAGVSIRQQRLLEVLHRANGKPIDVRDLVGTDKVWDDEVAIEGDAVGSMRSRVNKALINAGSQKQVATKDHSRKLVLKVKVQKKPKATTPTTHVARKKTATRPKRDR